LVIAIPVGTFLVFAIPPFQGLDEPNHFFRVFTITDGTLVPPTVHGGTTSVEIAGRTARVHRKVIRYDLEAKGVVVPGCVIDYYAVNMAQARRAQPMNDATFFRSPPRCEHVRNAFVIFDNTAINSPLAYAPQVVGVGLLRAVGAPLPVVFYGGRLFGLAAFVALVGLAIRITPRGKGVLFLVGLLPMSLEGAAVYSADPMTEALVLLVVALTLRCCLDEDAHWAYFGALAGAAWWLSLCKEPYGLLALVPAARLRNAERGPQFTVRAVTAVKVAVIAVAALLGGAWWYVGVRGVTLTADYPPGAINPSYQFHFFEHHPLSLGKELVRSWSWSGTESFTVSGVVSSLGFFRHQQSSEFAPMALVILVFVALFAAYQHEWGPRLALGGWQRVATLLPLGLAVLIGVLIYLEAAVRVTAPGSLVVSPLAVQGRLFVPLLAVPVGTVALLRAPPRRPVPIRWLVLATLVLSTYLVIKVFIRFY
jgi:uncharacterized membrane protein